MKTVVITGSTRGIGRGLAENFLARGCSVVISGRRQADVDALIDFYYDDWLKGKNDRQQTKEYL